MSDTQPFVRRKKAARKSRVELVSERLLKDEVVMASGVVSSGIFWRSAAVFILALVVMILIAHELGIFLGIVAVLMAIHAIILKEVLLLVVTNKRILVRYGILQVDVVDIHFDKVESMELARMLPGFLLGYANVVIMGTGNRYIVMPYIGNAVEIRRSFNEQTLGEEKA
jgi:hypothetical protein